MCLTLKTFSYDFFSFRDPRHRLQRGYSWQARVYIVTCKYLIDIITGSVDIEDDFGKFWH